VILRQHGVFLAYLGLALLWNGFASRRGPDERRPAWERLVLLPLVGTAAVVLVRDRLVPTEPAWLLHPGVPWLFPAAFVLTLAQNVTAMARRGVRLTDIPLVLYNAGMLLALTTASLVVAGRDVGVTGATLVHAHAILQGLLGHRLAHLWTLSWHVPLLATRVPPRTLIGVFVSLLPASVAAFAALMLVVLHGPAARVVGSFAGEARVTALRADLHTGVLARVDGTAPSPAPPGSLDAWVVPADHDGEGLARDAESRPLVVALCAPAAWSRDPPPPEDRADVFVAGAERIAAALRPDLLLPFPEPDGEATLFFGPETTPEVWRTLTERAAARVRAASPDTRVGLRLAGVGRRSAELFAVLARAPACVDVLGPRLDPAGLDPGRAAYADQVLGTWTAWREPLTRPPELWILAAGLSPLAYGEVAQARFLEGCLARAHADPAVRAILVDGWRDRGHTLGVLRADGSPRRAARHLAELLPPADER